LEYEVRYPHTPHDGGIHSVCGVKCGPYCDSKVLAAETYELPSRERIAEARHRTEIEPHGVRDRRLPFPYVMLLVAFLFGLGSAGLIWFAGNGLGWW
jgi:hypothetical protein